MKLWSKKILKNYNFSEIFLAGSPLPSPAPVHMYDVDCKACRLEN